MQTTTTVRLEQSVINELDSLATKLDRPRSWVIKEAINQFIADDVAFRRAVQEGIDDVQAGRTVPHEKVVSRIRKMGIDVD